ncbi:hypothetical protein AAG565_09580 [Fontimonas sp. SYSU GA230001]|uniref:hypothetical protein n=1 Tax=Fontimonas sp. SYSU GA230001 TaxID=3142450 RepID=UPI0032B4439D
MASKQNLFEAATAQARVVKQGDLVQVVIDGGGAFVTTLEEFSQARKWAERKAASGNRVTDRGRFFEQIGTLISRPGTQAATRGNIRTLEGLARKMKAGGYELGDWGLPPELRFMQTGEDDPREIKKKSELKDAPGTDQAPDSGA